jgi:Ca2+-binding RTX toxin-like protein
LASANHIEFDGSAETDGSFRFQGGGGNDIFTGGAQADQFLLNVKGNDVMNGGGGADVFDVSSGFTSADRLNGGDGNDSILLSQDLSNGLSFGALTIGGIETIHLAAGHGYTLTTDDANVAAAAALTIDGSALAAAGVLHFNGSAETDGRFVLLGGAADDAMRGGAMNDKLTAGAGADKLIGGDGRDVLTGGLGGDYLYGSADNDRFVLSGVAESTVAGADWIRDWNAGDRIDVSAIDANTGVAGD